MRDIKIDNPKIVVCSNSLQCDKWMTYYCDYDFESWKPPKNRVNWIINTIGDAKDLAILDVGCGAYPVTEGINAKEKVGIDISLKTADRVAENFDKLYIADLVHLRKSDVSDLLGRFDYVVLAETLEHFDNAAEIIVKMRWFLKPKGKLIVTYPNHFSLSMHIDYFFNNGKYVRYADFMEGHFTFYRLEQLKFIFRASGFKIDGFGFRPCDLLPERFPKEDSKIWRYICRVHPSRFAHQFFFCLSKENDSNLFPRRFNVVIEKGVKIIKDDVDVVSTHDKPIGEPIVVQ